MTTTATERPPGLTERPPTPDDADWKVSPTGVISKTADGVVTALVSVTGIYDEVGDRIIPGAYSWTLGQRIPKGVFSHDWDTWVSRTDEIVELMPGDSRLPKVDRKGAPWPKEAGALLVRTAFNLGTQAGRDTYSNVVFFDEGPLGPQVEWSVGYNAKQAKRLRDGRRDIHVMDLYEYGPVLFGAAPLAGTLLVGERKSLEAAVAEAKVAGREVTPKDVANTERLKQYWEHGEGAAKIRWGVPGDFNRCVRLVVQHAHMTPERAKGYCANRHKGATGAWPGHAATEQTAKKEHPMAPETKAADTVETPPAEGYDPAAETGEDAGATSTETPTAVTPPEGTEEAAPPAADAEATAPAGTEAPAAADAETPAGEGETPAPEGETPPAPEGYETDPLGDVPAGDDEEDLSTPADVLDGGEPEGEGDDTAPGDEPAAEEGKDAPGGTEQTVGPGTPQGTEVKGVPATERRAAAKRGHAMPDGSYPIRDHGEVSKAVALFPKGAGVNGKTEAGIKRHIIKRARALGAPHKIPDSWKGGSSTKAAEAPLSYKEYPYLPGSVEERQAAIREAVEDALLPEPDAEGRTRAHLNLDATFADEVLVTLIDYSEGGDEPDRQSFVIGYTVDDDGAISLGEPQPVDKVVTLVPSSSGGDTEAEVASDAPVGVGGVASRVPTASVAGATGLLGKAIAAAVEGKDLGPAERGRLDSALALMSDVATALRVDDPEVKALLTPAAAPAGTTPAVSTPDVVEVLDLIERGSRL